MEVNRVRAAPNDSTAQRLCCHRGWSCSPDRTPSAISETGVGTGQSIHCELGNAAIQSDSLGHLATSAEDDALLHQAGLGSARLRRIKGQGWSYSQAPLPYCRLYSSDTIAHSSDTIAQQLLSTRQQKTALRAGHMRAAFPFLASTIIIVRQGIQCAARHYGAPGYSLYQSRCQGKRT